MEATCSSETSIDFQWTTRRYIQEDKTLDNRVRFPVEGGTFLFYITSRHVLGSSQSQIQLVQDTLSPGVNWSEHEAERSSLSTAEVNTLLFYEVVSICSI
jgi:hypothetical protein